MTAIHMLSTCRGSARRLPGLSPFLETMVSTRHRLRFNPKDPSLEMAHLAVKSQSSWATMKGLRLRQASSRHNKLCVMPGRPDGFRVLILSFFSCTRCLRWGVRGDIHEAIPADRLSLVPVSVPFCLAQSVCARVVGSGGLSPLL